jgi:hypothetical protein
MLSIDLFYIINHMATTRKAIDAHRLYKLPGDPVVAKIATALDVKKLSILSLLTLLKMIPSGDYLCG